MKMSCTQGINPGSRNDWVKAEIPISRFQMQNAVTYKRAGDEEGILIEKKEETFAMMD